MQRRIESVKADNDRSGEEIERKGKTKDDGTIPTQALSWSDQVRTV